MGDVSTLLREAVPVEQIEPDIDAVAGRVRSRRRRRTLLRVAASLVVVVGIGGSAVAVAGQGRDAAQVETVDPADSTAHAAAGGDATEFTRLLASRPWLYAPTLDVFAWPVQPAEFLGADAGVVPPEAVVVGVLEEVRSDDDGRPICMFAGGCFSQPQLRTTVRVERVLSGDLDPPVTVDVLWGLDVEEPSGESTPPESGVSGWMFEPAAPIGARVLVFLVEDGGRWHPIEPSGIVIDDPQGVAVPQPDIAAADLDISFDDYVSEVERILSAR